MKPAQRTTSAECALIGLIVAECSACDVPASWPDASRASPAAPAPGTAFVTRALEVDPAGWNAQPPGTVAGPADPERLRSDGIVIGPSTPKPPA